MLNVIWQVNTLELFVFCFCFFPHIKGYFSRPTFWKVTSPHYCLLQADMRRHAPFPPQINTSRWDRILRWFARVPAAPAKKKSTGSWTTFALTTAFQRPSTPQIQYCDWKISLSPALHCSVLVILLIKSSEGQPSKHTVRKAFCYCIVFWQYGYRCEQWDEIFDKLSRFSTPAKPSKISCILEATDSWYLPDVFICSWEHQMNSSLKIKYTVTSQWWVSQYLS